MPDIENEVEQEQPAQAEQAQDTNESDMVDIHSASIEDLDAALENALNQEPEAPAAPGSADQESEQAETPPAGNQEPQADNAPGPDVAPDAGAEPSKPQQQDEIQGLRAENERLRKEGNQKELFIQRRNNELGTLRQQLAALRQEKEQLKARLEAGLEDRFAENPVQAANDRDTIKELQSDLDEIDARGKLAEQIVNAQTFFVRHVNTDVVGVDDIAAVLKRDGMDERFIAQFKSNPWTFTTPEALVQMGKRAEDVKNFQKADDDRHVLAKYVLKLEEELKAYKKKSSNIVSNIQRNLNRVPSVTAASSAAPKQARDVDPSRMSIAELDAALKASMNGTA